MLNSSIWKGLKVTHECKLAGYNESEGPRAPALSVYVAALVQKWKVGSIYFPVRTFLSQKAFGNRRVSVGIPWWFRSINIYS